MACKKMKFVIVALACLSLFAAFSSAQTRAAEWQGVDKKVIEKYAVAAGRPPREPLINADKGDLLLFVFLIAGAAGGFVAGYCFRALFPPKKIDRE